MSQSGGFTCAFKDCKANTKRNKAISFFRFPKDAARSKLWIDKCRRQDLLEKATRDLYKNFRVCGQHFEERDFANDLKNRLHPTAVPKISKHWTPRKHDTEVSSKIVILQDTVIKPASKLSVNTVKHQDKEELKQQVLLPANVQATTSSPNTHQLSAEMTAAPAQPTRDMVPTLLQSREEKVIKSTCYEEQTAIPSTSACVQTPASFSTQSPRKQKLRKKLRAAKRAQCRKQLSQEFCIENVTLHQYMQLCDKFLPETTSQFVKIQAQHHNNIPNIKYSKDVKQMCLSLYFAGPKAYEVLSTMFKLPCKRTLQRITENIKFSPGVQQHVLDILKVKVDHFQYKNKHCVLCIDEISLKSHLFYHIGRDEVIGLEDMGQGKTMEVASNGAVILIRGLYNKWKQPLSFFLSKTAIEGKKLKEIVVHCIEKLKDIGLNVVAVVSDMGSNFLNLFDLLIPTYASNGNTFFEIKGHKIYYVFDTPHLMKTIRNNLMKYSFEYKNMRTKWEYIEQFYEADKKLHNRLAPKLSDAHIRPTAFEKMKVKYATQLLSASVAAGLNTYISLKALPSDAIEIVSVVERFDKLFDLLNSSSFNSKKQYNQPFQGFPYQIELLTSSLEYLSNVKVLTNKGKDVTNTIKCIKGWIITIRSIMGLWTDLKIKGYRFILTRRVNQDALENYFGSMRKQGGNAVTVTPIQFYNGFRKLFYLTICNTGSENCTEDFDVLLSKCSTVAADIAALNIACVEHQASSDSELHVKVHTGDYYSASVTEENAVTYICGYLIKKTVTLHTCDICRQYAQSHQELDVTSLFCHFKNYKSNSTFGNLQMPHKGFVNYIVTLEQHFFSNLNIIKDSNVLRQCYDILKNISFVHPCKHFPYEYLLKLYCRVRLFYFLKFTNRTFQSTTRSLRKITILCNN